MVAELGSRFQLSQVLKTSLIPVVYFAESPPEALHAYASLHLKEEVQAEGLVRNIGNFARFLEAASFSHGCLLNVTNMAGDCDVERRTVQGYVAILQDLLLAYTVPVFTKRAKRHMVRRPKFYLFDARIFRTLRPSGPLDRPEETEGVALEGLVAQHLRAWLDYSDGRRALYYWRTKSGVEVDFWVCGENAFVALEVKNAGKVRSSDLRSLRAFIHDFPEAQALLIYRGQERLLIDGIHCIPCEHFLRNMHPDQPLAP